MKPKNAGMLKLTRQARGWTMRDLAKQSGVSIATLSRVESYGWSDLAWRRFGVTLAKTLGVSIEDLSRGYDPSAFVPLCFPGTEHVGI